jgi:hypothetical protein
MSGLTLVVSVCTSPVFLSMRCKGGEGSKIEGPPVASASHSDPVKRTPLVHSGAEWSIQTNNQPPMREHGIPESNKRCVCDDHG